MDFIDKYKDNLSKALEIDLDLAGKLISNFHKLGVAADVEIYYLEAIYFYYTRQYALALLYADLAYSRDASYEPIYELINYLTEYSGDFSEYRVTFNKDVSAYNEKYNILMFKGALPAADYLVDALAHSFDELGHNVEIIDISNNTIAELEMIFSKSIDFAFLINNIGLMIETDDEKNVYEKLQIRVFDFLFDHPMYYDDSLNNPVCDLSVICVDKNHVKYTNRFYKNINTCFFMPLGSEEDINSESIPWKERSINVLYLGSLKEASRSLSDEFSDFVYEYMRSNSSLTTEYSIEKCYKECDRQLFIRVFGEESLAAREDISGDKLKEIIEKYRFVDMQINSYYRKRLVSVLVENGIDVDVYGWGWQDTQLLNNEHFHCYNGKVSQRECLKMMKNTKFVLNSMPWFKDGSHDRVYNAMLAGALCITDESKYLTDEFTDKAEIIYYKLDDIEEVYNLIMYYENHPDEAERIANAGYRKAALGHTWQRRAIELLERYSDMKAVNSFAE